MAGNGPKPDPKLPFCLFRETEGAIKVRGRVDGEMKIKLEFAVIRCVLAAGSVCKNPVFKKSRSGALGCSGLQRRTRGTTVLPIAASVDDCAGTHRVSGS